MRKIGLILLTLITLSSCGSAKNNRVVTKKAKTSKTVRQTTNSTRKVKTTNTAAPKIVQSIIKNAEKYEGTPYKYGGTTKKGMDCSGLIYTAFNEENLKIPRTTSTLSSYGDWIDLKKVRKGDLLFFATQKNSRKVNHIGLVTAIVGDNVEFIHASSSKGVMTSKLKEKYWYFAFVQARRVL